MRVRLPKALREWMHELASPRGAWISNKIVDEWSGGLPVTGQDEAITTEASVAMLLSSYAFKQGATEISIAMTGQTSSGEPIGDWEVVVRKIQPVCDCEEQEP